jgi:chloramphenicol 3-O phosphotransferase
MGDKGRIIVLNGTSSSGKTSLVKALQKVLEEPYLDAGLDKFIWILPGRYLDRPLWDDVLGLATEAGEMGHRLVSGMHQAIAALSDAGLNVVADHVLVEPAWVQECAALFAERPAYLVGVRCPLEVLIEREKARNDRTLGQAEAQYLLVHVHGLYDLEVDTSVLNSEECAWYIKQQLENGLKPGAWPRLAAGPLG